MLYRALQMPSLHVVSPPRQAGGIVNLGKDVSREQRACHQASLGGSCKTAESHHEASVFRKKIPPRSSRSREDARRSPDGTIHDVDDEELYHFCKSRQLRYQNLVDHKHNPESDQKNGGWRLT